VTQDANTERCSSRAVTCTAYEGQMDITLFREETLKSILQQSAENYKDNVRIISVIEDKAQKATILASALLAAGLAFLKGENFGNGVWFGGDILLLLAIAIFLLITCNVTCLRVMWVRTTAAPLSVEQMVELAQDLFAAPNEILERQEPAYWDKIGVWRHTLSLQQQVIERKAKELRFAQIILTAGITAIALVLLDLIVKVLLGRIAFTMFSGGSQ
jgi:hypothetical protein